MCGIFCEISEWGRVHPTPGQNSAGEVNSGTILCTPQGSIQEKTRELLGMRGPDSFSEIVMTFENYKARLTGHTLWTQGSGIQEQPLVASEGHQPPVFCFNGDIYSVDGSPLPPNKNDGVHLFEQIQSSKDDTEFIELFSRIEGPFAFILFQSDKNRLWFGRDVFGRSNLLLSSSFDTSGFFISSVTPFSEDGDVIEIPSGGIFCLDLKTLQITLYPWACLVRRTSLYQSANRFLEFVRERLNLSSIISRSVCPSVSTALRSLPNTIGTDRILNELKSLSEAGLPDHQILISARSILQEHIGGFLSKLRTAVRKRVELKPPFCKQCMLLQREGTEVPRCEHSKISILFSGGLDSTVLGFLICEVLQDGDSLDLVNVAFGSDEKSDFSVPDRVTGLQSFRVLHGIFAPRGLRLNFVQANVVKTEVTKVRDRCVLDLISPLKSVLDDSIGCCLWFAARGVGEIRSEDDPERTSHYKSPARIIFVGSGADELLGGYSRHRSAFENRGWTGLVDEMQEDIDRISMRNIGRDNRIIASHGVCPRIPFLDESVVRYLCTECDPWVKCCPLFPRGLGEKILLRATALELFGEENIHLALFPKRAMQFGSRIAKLENSKEKGGDVCERLKSKLVVH